MKAFTIGVIPDTHFNDHDVQATRAALKLMDTIKPDVIVHLGDLVDHTAISRFALNRPDDQAKRLVEEWRPAKQFLLELRKTTKQKRVVLLQGNHEARLDKFIKSHPALDGVIDLPSWLGLNSSEYIRSDLDGIVLRFEIQAGKVVQVVRDPYKPQPTMFHGATFIHGWRHTIHHAKLVSEMVPWPGPVISGDVHDQQSFSANRWGMDKPSVFTIGHLTGPMEYIKGRPTRREQGVGVVRLDPRHAGLWQVLVHRIYDGTVIGPDGVVYA